MSQLAFCRIRILCEAGFQLVFEVCRSISRKVSQPACCGMVWKCVIGAVNGWVNESRRGYVACFLNYKGRQYTANCVVLSPGKRRACHSPTAHPPQCRVMSAFFSVIGSRLLVGLSGASPSRASACPFPMEECCLPRTAHYPDKYCDARSPRRFLLSMTCIRFPLESSCFCLRFPLWR